MGLERSFGRMCGVGRVLFRYVSEISRISHDKEAYMTDLMKFSNAVLHWDLSFMRVVQD